jgi:Domain of unknown function (DUF1931)
VTFGEQTEDVLIAVLDGLSVAPARSFRIIDGNRKNPSSEHWKRAFTLLRLLV